MNLNNKLGIGTVQFGVDYGISNKQGKTSFGEVKRILNLAQQNGVFYLDTASAYGNAEKVIGECNLTNFKVVSKFMPTVNNNSISGQLNESLENLKIENIYGYLAHRPSTLMMDERWDELVKLKTQGKVEKIGYSINTMEEVEILIEEGKIPDIIQLPYNYFDNRFKNIIINLKAKGTEIHTRSAFLQGLFFTEVETLHGYFDSVKMHIKELQEKYKENLPSVLLKYVLSKDFIDVVVIGVENKTQLDNNLKNIISAESLKDNEKCYTELILNPSNWPKIK